MMKRNAKQAPETVTITAINAAANLAFIIRAWKEMQTMGDGVNGIADELLRQVQP